MINGWVAANVCPRSTAAERVGKAVDELACAYVGAEFVLIAAEHGSAECVHDAWSEASSLAVRWTDLVAEVVDGQPPVPWRPQRTTPK